MVVRRPQPRGGRCGIRRRGTIGSERGLAKKTRKQATPAPATARRGWDRWVEWIESRPLAVAIVLIAVGSLRIVSTYAVFNHTPDEPLHLACGMEWVQKGVYQYEAQHPPLARVATALG